MYDINDENWFRKLFINEAKAVLGPRDSGNGVTTISTEAEMDAILANATDADVGKFYLYSGVESDKYENDAIYKIERG